MQEKGTKEYKMSCYAYILFLQEMDDLVPMQSVFIFVWFFFLNTWIKCLGACQIYF